MTKDLYFIPLIADALRQSEPEMALREAFWKIKTLGRKPEYKQGFLQFQRFMDEVRRSGESSSQISEDTVPTVVREVALQLATGLFKGDQNETQAALDLIRSRSGWREEFEKLWEEASTSEWKYISPEIIVEKEGERICSIPFESGPATKAIKNVKPGRYTFKIDTGRVIWEGNLTKRQLLWTYAFPEQDLDLAADTGEAVLRITREFKLLNGEVIIRVFPEIESGRLEVEIRG